ncbi:MAG: hypothetical protein J5936_05500 [Acholeplasmatales bacterium]|nr:hypothetical protein [Acholeplasmatales bacterium]
MILCAKGLVNDVIKLEYVSTLDSSILTAFRILPNVLAYVWLIASNDTAPSYSFFKS